MADSLRDQLLKSGIVKQVKDEKRQQQPLPKSNAAFAKGKPAHKSKPAHENSEIDLAKAYAIRAQTEAQERKRAEREAAELARLKRERKAKVQKLLEGQALNTTEADQVRHFEYGGKIRRMYVDAAQLTDLNAGKLGIVQSAGRYLLVAQEVAEQVRAVDPHLVALLVDPAAASVDDDGIPNDLMW